MQNLLMASAHGLFWAKYGYGNICPLLHTSDVTMMNENTKKCYHTSNTLTGRWPIPS